MYYTQSECNLAEETMRETYVITGGFFIRLFEPFSDLIFLEQQEEFDHLLPHLPMVHYIQSGLLSPWRRSTLSPKIAKFVNYKRDLIAASKNIFKLKTSRNKKKGTIKTWFDEIQMKNG